MICPTNQTLETDPGQSTATTAWIGPNTTDNSQMNITTTCNASTGSQLKIGQTDVVCEAWDMSRNYASCAFTIQVKGKRY